MDTKTITQKINESVNKLYIMQDCGERNPPVCLLCDRFIKPEKMELITIKQLQKHQHLLQPNPIFKLTNSLINCYKIENPLSSSTINEQFDIGSCMLSPRSSYLLHENDKKKDGFTICNTCNLSINKGNIPKFCIANNYCFGTPPQCLLDLTDIELAMLTPVKNYGFIFSYTGGVQKLLKGNLSYYKIKKEAILRTIVNASLLQLNNNIVVIFHGEMTTKQHDKANIKRKIRTHVVRRALQWLVTHNKEWMPLQNYYTNMVDNLPIPHFIDESIKVDSSTDEDALLLESNETFRVHYPDGTISTLTGGQDNIDKFKHLVTKVKLNNYDIEYQCKVMKKSVRDYEDNNLVNACVLQFPYGTGGMHELHLHAISYTNNVDISEYIQYLSMQSQPQFQTSLFSLILYNMHIKYKMVRTASCKVRQEADANFLANEITQNDVNQAISLKRNARINFETSKYCRGQKLLGAIDTVCKAVPHTNEAAKVATRNIETMQHHFGCPTFFLTVTPDDENHILIQIYSEFIIDTDEDVNQLSNDVLINRAKKRNELRLKFPGICALFFELALNIIIKDVLGWDMQNQKPIEGIHALIEDIRALHVSVEEQGKHTLHAHILVWTKRLNNAREKLHSARIQEQRSAKHRIVEAIDKIASTKCFFNDRLSKNYKKQAKAFPHHCNITNVLQQKKPSIVCDQELRYLRYKRSHDKAFGYCKSCSMEWSSKQLLSSYLINSVSIPLLQNYPDSEVRRLKSLAIDFQKSTQSSNEIDKAIIDAAYNFHIHTSSCFEKIKTGHTDNKHHECRYRYPQRPKRATTIQNASRQSILWYKWDGSNEKRYIKEVCLKRSNYDAFQNVYCPQISYSKLTCNTNISFVMPGPIAQYCVNYTVKGTQKQDSEEYELVKRAIEKILSKPATSYESDKRIAQRRILASSFVHQSNNIVGATLASFLTRNKSRFISSHSVAWCPLRDLQKLLNGQQISVLVTINNNCSYFQSSALNYLCRPKELNKLSPFDFYSQYNVVKKTSTNEDNLLSLQNTRYFKHPSFCIRTKSFRQGVQQLKKKTLVKIYQYEFPDTAHFQHSIWDYTHKPGDLMEKYCEQVLLLCLPYRRKQDLLLNHSYTKRLRYAIVNEIVTRTHLKFLQNLQDCRSNSFRIALMKDDLQRHTLSVNESKIEGVATNANDEQSSDCNSEIDFSNRLFDIFQDVENNFEANDDSDIATTPESYNCKTIRQKGRLNCGFNCLPSFTANHMLTNISFIESEETDTAHHTEQPVEDDSMIEIEHPTQQNIVNIFLTYTDRQENPFRVITGESRNNSSVMQANGTVHSIIDWSMNSNLDPYQRRAFEIITGAFVLSFYYESEKSDNYEHRPERNPFNKQKRKLQKLVDEEKRNNESQLIMFLHGPAGSGKTAVVDLALSYAKSYCNLIWPNVTSFKKLITVTAMTGVAATLLQGQTTHAALFLNQEKQITHDQVDLWFMTKMLIIDEISFASNSDLKICHDRLCQLKDNPHCKYGGIHVIFCGDMCQLEPVGSHKKPIYAEHSPYFKDWVNCYIELGGIHRFKDDAEWGKILLRLRQGKITNSDIDKINSRVVSNGDPIPEDIRYATFYNRDRDAINSAIFEEKVTEFFNQNHNTDGFIMIFSDNHKIRNSVHRYVPFHRRKLFWENCGENDLKFSRGSGRMDPVLKLFYGCRVMLPRNEDVESGLANGTQATVQKVVLKPGVTPQLVRLHDDVQIPSVLASQVQYIELKHSNVRIETPLFSVQPKEHTFKAKLPIPTNLQIYSFKETETIPMKATQIPLIVTNATTGHKLQGTGVDKLFVHSWYYTTNWVYTMLSRVSTLQGLYTRIPLVRDPARYRLPNSLQHMISDFQSRKPTMYNEVQYMHLINT